MTGIQKTAEPQGPAHEFGIIALPVAAGLLLPAPAQVWQWSSDEFTSALRHDPSLESYKRSFRQLLHVGCKIAATTGRRYLDLLEANERVIAKNVTYNLCARHIRPVFLGTA